MADQRFAGAVLLAEELSHRIALGALADTVPGFAVAYVAGIDQLLTRNPAPEGVGDVLRDLRAIVVGGAQGSDNDLAG